MRFLIYALATWRLSHLLAAERGPYDVLGKLRQACGVSYADNGAVIAPTEAAMLITCVWCNSVWVAAGLWLVRLIWPALGDGLAGVFAASTVAVFAEGQIDGTQ